VSRLTLTLFGSLAIIERARLGEYDEVKDFQALQAEGDFITVRPGMFVIFAPQDAHMPNIAGAEPRLNKPTTWKSRRYCC